MIPDLVAVITKQLDRMVTAHLNTETHAFHLLNKISREQPIRAALKQVHKPIRQPTEFHKDVKEVGLSTKYKARLVISSSSISINDRSSLK